MNDSELKSIVDSESQNDTKAISSTCPNTTPSVDANTLTKLNAARSAYDRAADAKKKLPKKFKKKTVASNGTLTLSGHKADEILPPGYTRTTEIQVQPMLEYSSTLPNYTPTKTGANDPKGLPGGNAATHAEKQLARYHQVEEIDQPIGVSEEQCGDCRVWFKEQAKSTNKEYVVADPEYTRIYKSDGSVEIYNQSNEHLETVDASTPPKANITNYQGVIW